MSLAPLWGILFFTMIFMLAIDSQFTIIETLVTALDDEFKVWIKRFIKRREILVLIVCIVLFFLSFPNICPV